MKESTKRVIKKIGKVVAIYYIIEVIALVVSTIYCAVAYGTDTVKRIYNNAFYHVKKFYTHIFHFRWKDAVREATDNSLDGSYACLQKACGKEFTDEVMDKVYDTLDKGSIPFSRKRCPADKKPDGVNEILEEMIRSGEINTVHLDEFESRPIDSDDVPEGIRKKAVGDMFIYGIDNKSAGE